MKTPHKGAIAIALPTGGLKGNIQGVVSSSLLYRRTYSVIPKPGDPSTLKPQALFVNTVSVSSLIAKLFIYHLCLRDAA